MRRYLPPMAAIAAAYALNRWLLVPLTGWRLLAWHGADFLAGALMLCVLNGLLALAGRPPVRGAAAASAFALACAAFWELVTPLYLSRSVADPWDAAAVWLGAMALLAWDRAGRKRP